MAANDIIDRHAVKDKEKFINSVLLSMNESSAEHSEKIKAEEVHNPVMVNGVKERKLTVYYKFVGQID